MRDANQNFSCLAFVDELPGSNEIDKAEEGADLENRDWKISESSAHVTLAITALPFHRLKNEQANPHYPLRRKRR